jgi:two-component system response regulator HydG
MSNVAVYGHEIPMPFASQRGASIRPRSASGRDRHLPMASPPTLATASRRALTRILVVSPDVDAQHAHRETFERLGREVLCAGTPFGVVDMILRAEVDLVVIDPQLTDNGACTLRDALRDAYPAVMTALLATPLTLDEASAFLQRADAMVAREHAAVDVEGAAPSSAFRGMYGNTTIMHDVFRMISRVGRTQVTVLVTGESGTGKELVARALHDESPRRNKPFVALNCSALPSELVESELFGHTRGAFTGAVKDHGGLFEAANGGTLFLDEIGDLGPLAQAKVLRALESGEVMRVGGTRATRVDVRVIAATNRPLDAMVADGRFREDLLYRLKVISLALPPLRDRPTDIPLLASHFLRVVSARHALPVRALSAEARALLVAYDWPGNVRELRNVIEGALVMCDGGEIDVCDLPAILTHRTLSMTRAPSLLEPLTIERVGDVPFVEARERALRDFDRAFLGAALARHGGNIARTARALGLHRQSLQKLLARRDLRNGEIVREI